MKRYLGRIIGVAVGAFGGPAGLLFGFLAGTLVDQTRRFARMTKGRSTTGGRSQTDEPKLLSETDCQVLSVPRTADRSAVRHAYRQLAVNLHPDSAPTLTEMQRTELAGAFERVHAAYENLMRELHEREVPGQRFSDET